MRSKTKKLIWAVPLMAAVAALGALAIFMTLTPNQAAAQDAEMLGPPTGLTATADGQTKIKLSWTGPAGEVSGYRVDVAKDDDGVVWEELEPANSGNITIVGAIGRYTATGLKAGSTQHFRVFAIDSTGDEGMPSASASATTAPATKSASPIDLEISTNTVPTADTITLEWDPPPALGGSDVTAYKIQRSKMSASGWSDLKTLMLIDSDLTDPTGDLDYAYTDKKLMANTTWYYRVIAINDAGESDPSDVVKGETADSAAPDPPANLVVQGSSSQVVLYWQASADKAGAPVTGYKIESNTGEWNTVVPNTRSRSTSFRAGGSTFSGGTVQYRVSAINAIGTSGASNVANASALPASGKDPVKSLSAKPDGLGKIKLTWALPPGGDDTTTYSVLASEDGSAWTVHATSGTTETHTHGADDDRLDANTRWYYLVFATTGTDNHKVSSRVTATTMPANTPAAPTTFTAVTDSTKSASQINLTIAGPTGDGTGDAPITGYQIRRSTNQIVWETIAANFDSDDNADLANTQYHDKGLSGGTTYYYQASAINSSGIGTVARLTQATAGAEAISAPTGLVAVARTGAEVDLYWNSPGDPDGDPLTGYWIEVSEDSGTTWSNVASSTMSRATTHTHKGAPYGKTLTYRVSAINSGGAGIPSITEEVTTPAPAAPDAPTVTATAASHTQINVSWTKPADNGSAITGYVLQRKMGTADYMTIAASNAATWWNTLDCAMMNGAVPADSTPAPGADATSPYCKMYDGLAADAKKVVDAAFAAGYATITGTSYADMGLMADTTYDYQVAAVNAVGKSAYGMATAKTQVVPNAAPAAGAALEPQSIAVSKTAMLTSTITDADMDDTLTWEWSSDKAEVATVVMDATNGSMATVTGVAEGTATIKVTATDPDGAMAEQTVTVIVINRSPVASGTIADMDLMTAGTSSMDVAKYFSDSDEQTLTYKASSDMEMYATASIPEGSSTLTVEGVGVGSATVTVTATDPAGATATQTFMVNVTQGAVSAPSNVVATVTPSTDPGGATSVTLTWTNGDNANRHIAVLFDANWEFMPSHLATAQDSGDVTFASVSPGTYTAVVIAIMDDDAGNAQAFEMATAVVTVN